MSGRPEAEERRNAPTQPTDHRVLLGDQRCPRCQKFFTMSYWSGEAMVQARCLSCDLKWPRPDVV